MAIFIIFDYFITFIAILNSYLFVKLFQIYYSIIVLLALLLIFIQVIFLKIMILHFFDIKFLN